ncbi:TPA: hypothetical protein DEW47_01395 [Patescibacteria group bacterium]|nr:MAG: Filamentation induced by cAMP protein Fic [Parcubacteria group bacterium GW2011_GWF2_40_10]KKR47378.1 MAG: Filamentation induced by cAMP protein Fic [Parcubacteria group bacterium GW2011_GWA2_40_143]KKR59766.1 MAG: Filamentation induced by cAMP protein Fic [Parcubacteria group bacterium GW2011_GWC2_40_31]KKR75287.1 MAG: Filamentation induced by cAMP protein Fic [Parcubacteria group bacterium GW2011_GWB2_40_8]KKR77360.1 MAG: Filamentation induced by cAMP protein Fic [Parcubacteria group 
MSFESLTQPTPPQEKQEPVEEKLETGKKVFEFLDRTKFLDVRKSGEQFNEWLQKLSYEDYTNYLTRLNGILREVPIKKRAVDGSGVEISFGIMGDISYLPPAAEQKDGLMRESFDALKQIPDNEDRALLTYYALQAIHPYSDGNGRTGRLLHEIISEDGKELTEEKLSELLDHDKDGHAGTGKGRDVFAEKVLDANSAYYYINREVAKEILGDDFFKEFGKIYYSGYVGIGNVPKDIEISPEERALAEKIIGEGDVANFPFRGMAILKLLQENGKLFEYQFIGTRPTGANEVVPEDVGKQFLGIDNDKFEAELTAEDTKRLIEIHKDIKNRFIRTMIDIFNNPDNHLLKTKDGKDVQIKDVFRR